MYLLFAVTTIFVFVGVSHSCDDACKTKRIKDCCENYVTNKACLPLCKYDTTIDELAAQGMECHDQLKYWMYCAADENDNTNCCKKTDLNSVCYPFCEGKVPKLCMNDKNNLSKFLDCATNADKILKCHKDNLSEQSKWKKNHVFPTESC